MSWIGNFPFPPDKKKPILITHDKEVSFTYGDSAGLIINRLFASTDKITFVNYDLSPGECFSPADIHGGDEVYYVLQGSGFMLNPETGEVLELNQGDSFLIPKGTWHQCFNYGKEVLRLFCFLAPLPWVDKEQMDMVLKRAEELREKAVFYKREE